MIEWGLLYTIAFCCYTKQDDDDDDDYYYIIVLLSFPKAIFWGVLKGK